MGYCQISLSLEVARSNVIMMVSLWNLTGISAALTDMSEALLPRCLSNFRALGKVWTRFSQIRDITRTCGKTFVNLVYRGLGLYLTNQSSTTNTCQSRKQDTIFHEDVPPIKMCWLYRPVQISPLTNYRLFHVIDMKEWIHSETFLCSMSMPKLHLVPRHLQA